MCPIETILDEALSLPPIQRVAIVEKILFSLNEPDKNIDHAWELETEDRLDAFDKGLMKAIPLDDVIAKLHK